MNARGTLGPLLLAALAAPALAQPTDLDGDWHLRVARKDKGAAVLTFGVPAAGVFAVDGIGMTLGLGEFFEITGQSLERDSAGRIFGTLPLEAVGGAATVGSLVVAQGTVSSSFTKLKLPGELTPTGGAALAVVGKGVRFPDPAPVLTGATTSARISGKGTKSKVYEISVEADPAGYPVFTFDGTGPVSIDGVEMAGVAMTGRFLLDPKGRIYGTFASLALGTGVVEGKLKAGDLAPRLRMKATAGGRRFKVKGDLVSPVSPILVVTPAGTAEFGSVSIGASGESVFSLGNVGLGTLTGEASIVSGGDPDFSVLDAGGAAVASLPYALDPGATVPVRVRFTPTVVGERRATLELTGGGGAVRTLRGLGASLAVVPSAGHDFGDVETGTNADSDFLVANVGTGPLAGEVVLVTGDPDFAIRSGGESVTSLVYELDPGEILNVTVRFRPESEGAKEGSLSFSGGASAVTRPVSGNGTAPPP